SRLASALLLFVATLASAQVPTIIDEIGQLEGVRDPKCYATANRLEDFIYGTPLQPEARFEKISLQKALIRAIWAEASTSAEQRGDKEIRAEVLRPLLQAAVPYAQTERGDWIVHPADAARTEITSRDKRQYSTVAYALRAMLSVQQDAFSSGANLIPLDPDAVELFKESIDLTTLAALQRADHIARGRHEDRISAAALGSGWKAVVDTTALQHPPVTAGTEKPQPARKFATIKSIVKEKLTAFEKYNDLSMTVFLRNIQVYMARHLWPSDPAEARRFKDQFTDTMVAFTHDVLLDADRRAKKAGHPFIRVEDVNAAVQAYEPHELNEYEDCIYFPRLPKNEQIVIEAYDLDSFRDPGLHWFYLSEVLNDPKYSGTLEPDPFAAELLTEGVAQMGTLILRVAGTFATADGSARLNHTHLTRAVKKIQRLIDENAAAPPVKRLANARIASAPGKPAAGSAGKAFTDITAESGIRFEHRISDWLSRLIRSYTVSDGNVVRLAVPPAFGGSGIAAEDIDNDGDIDVLILSGSGNALDLNDGKGHFTDVTEAAGLDWKRADGTHGEPRQPIIADFDNDGLPDILITYANDDHRLYRNLGNARFQDVTARSGLGGNGLVGGPATAIDFDKDGLLDLYIGYFGDYPHGVLPTLSRRNMNALPNKLFRNKGNFVFQDVTAGSGVDNRGWAQAIGHLDFDGDGLEDLICGNDFGTNAWYRNLGNGRFEDVSSQIGTDKPSYTMNIGVTDLNRDGHPDVYISNIVTMDKDEKYVLPDERTRMKFNAEKMANMRVVEANDLFTSTAHGGRVSYQLSDAVGRGYRSTGWSWGANFFDYDNDGDDDLYVVNGMNEYAVYSSINPYFTDSSGKQRDAFMPVEEKERNVFFVNRNGRLLEDLTGSGADLLGNSRSVAYLDIDGDGDLDMIVNNFEAPAVVDRNNMQSNGNHWIKIRLVGDPSKGVTRDAIGARIVVDTAHEKGMWREVFSTVGYLTSNPKEQHVGLGKDTNADVTVLWPDGTRQTFKGLAADRSYRIVQGIGVQ
ncbi:MAG TPA: CRTAC1 family protein, partial [Thermoanaerobaculia bacterium]|nr:CRTAC1 family protein [Thermoanaerobaculia bacterium]